MGYVVVFLATRWGSELGGINVFNTGLAKGMTRILPKEGGCICYVEELPNGSSEVDGVHLRQHLGNARDIADDIENFCFHSDGQHPRGLLVVGHDVKTGKIAIDCVAALKSKIRGTEFMSAVISHMDYAAYGRKKGQTLDQVAARSRGQHETVAEADLAFAVGPLLESSFQVARKQGDAERKRVQKLVPGAADIRSQPEDESQALRFFVSGRLNREDDTIKNGCLSIEALLEAYKTQRDLGEKRWETRGQLFVYGVDQVKDASLLAPLIARAQNETAFEIEPQPFSDDQEKMYVRLASSHVALMPSWHEGFGLTGWEALCAGVPLVCSRQSGLALLLNELRQQFPDVRIESVEYVNLAGSTIPGAPVPQDISTVAGALARIVKDYPRRKKAALLLAKRLKAEYTWERCAHELIVQTDWDLPSSVDWSIRKKVASRAAFNDVKGVEDGDIVSLALESCTDGHIERDWSVVCSALNYFSTLGKTKIAERKLLLQQLETIGTALTQALSEQESPEGGQVVPAIKDTGNLDLCWRYMAACSSVADKFREFSRMISQELLDTICSESFLQRELLYYVCRRFAKDFPHPSQTLAVKFLEPVQQLLDGNNLLQVRLARLAAVYPEILHVIEPKTQHQVYHDEAERCQRLLDLPHDVTTLLRKAPELAPTLLALSGLKPDVCRQSIDQALHFISDYQLGPVELSWRGDKRLYAGILTSGIPSRKLLKLLESMASDEEEAVRWAAVELAFSRTLRSRLEAAANADGKGVFNGLLGRLGAIVDKAVKFDGGHPWLQREFLRLYAREHSQTAIEPTLPKFSIHDFPYSRQLFGLTIGTRAEQLLGARHPEVRAERAAAQRIVKRVLLVLPPIETARQSRHGASITSTPPLGLGLIASELSRRGHDVQLADCHRYPQLYEEISKNAYTFDLIGFNVVLSTVRSTHLLHKEIRQYTSRPLLVVGGPAAKLDAWRFSALDDDDRRTWDFAISNAEFENLKLLIDSLDTPGPWPVSRNLVANEDSQIVALRDVQQIPERDQPLISESWRSTPWIVPNIDRRIYQGPAGRYEPTKTRAASGILHEAHVVMSQGCDWNCTFCTERKSLSGGERRRSVDSVLNELDELSRSYSHLRIQFIDDNLLPQIAVADNIVSQAKAMDWADSFLRGLCTIGHKLHRPLGWRGIFRLEDFFCYEGKWSTGNFVALLAESGCRMLAFGVEHGDEDRRRRLKAGTTYGNREIADLFARLRAAGIHTKAYFMLGGKAETRESTEKTIAFALESGVTLAYFALYKEFVKATKELSHEVLPESEQAARFLTYSQLWLRWDDQLLNEPSGSPEGSQERVHLAVSPEAVSCYRELADLGFRFQDIVKYNDFHSETGPSGSLLSQITWDSPSDYFRAIEEAYLRFYLRPKFVEDYKNLIASGY